MDPDIARWVLDFLVRQPIDDSTLTLLLTTLPLSNTDNNLKKHLLLKKIDSEISNASISENVLGLLEQIEEVDHRCNVEISDSLKRAYCVVAVHCTVKFLEEGVMDLYFEAVKNIWRAKIACMLKFEKAGLVSDELISWKDDIETAVWDDSVCKGLLKKWKGLDVVEIVRVYVEEARKMMGPSFLEHVAETMSRDAVKEVFGIDKEEINKGNVQHKSKPSAVKKHKKFNSRTTRGVKIVDNDDPSPMLSSNKYGCLSPTEVTKLQEELRTSTSSLQGMVRDPLPDALNMAKNVASNMDSVDGNTEKSNLGNKGSPLQVDGNTEKSNLGNECSPLQVDGNTEKSNLGNECSPLQTNATKASLMERNKTAHTCEWEKSTDGSASPASKFHLPSPKKRVVSPLKKHETPKPLRRKRKFWSNEEEDTLRTGVKKYGVGNWKLILNMYKDIFDDRTEVDLKDKWRNLIA